MTIDPTNAGASNIVERAKNILLTPQAEWDRIAAEETTVGQLYTGYALPLAVLSALCTFIGICFIGVMGFRVGIVAGLVGAVIQVVMAMVGLFVMAFVTNALAPNFGSQQNMGQAHKLAVYGSTAGFLAGVFTILPMLAILAIVGLYSLALIYIGLPRLMKTPEDKRIGYFVTIIVVCIVVGIVLNVVVGALRPMIPGYTAPGYSFSQNTVTAPNGEVTLPGGGTVDLGALEKQAEALQAGQAIPAVDPMRLQEQLPQSLPGGFALTSASSSSAMGVSQAEGVYQSGDARLTVNIVQLGGMAALAGMAGIMNVQENRQDANGYARAQTIDGRVYSEEVRSGDGVARYGVVGHGIAVTADGSGGVTLDQARAAVDTIGVQRLENQFGAS